MSRYTEILNKNIKINFGWDATLGSFVDIIDKRYVNIGKDEQGEGYLVEWTKIWGFTQNKIGIKQEELKNGKRIEELINKFLETL